MGNASVMGRNPPLATPSSQGAMSPAQLALVNGATQNATAAITGGTITGVTSVEVDTPGYDAGISFARGANAGKGHVGGYGDGNGGVAVICANGKLNSGGSLVQAARSYKTTQASRCG